MYKSKTLKKRPRHKEKKMNMNNTYEVIFAK